MAHWFIDTLSKVKTIVLISKYEAIITVNLFTVSINIS